MPALTVYGLVLRILGILESGLRGAKRRATLRLRCYPAPVAGMIEVEFAEEQVRVTFGRDDIAV